MDQFDRLALVGVLLLTTGAGMVYIPAGLIVGGIACLVVAVLGAKSGVQA